MKKAFLNEKGVATSALIVAIAAIVIIAHFGLLIKDDGPKGVLALTPENENVPPSATLHITAKYNAADENSTVVLTIEHAGGDAITVSDIKLIADNSAMTQYEESLDQLTTETSLTVGHSYELDNYPVVGLSAGDTITVKLIHVPSSQTIYDRSDILIEGVITPDVTIYIDGDNDFIPANGVVGGSGTENDPYIIENWDINAENAHGIWIKNTTAHFIIHNCYVHNGRANYNQNYGIYFYNVVNGAVDNNLLRNNYFGIRFDYSNNNLIFNNTMENHWNGILLDTSSSNSIISNSIMTNEGFVCIWLVWNSDNNLVSNNIAGDNYYCGIQLGGSNSNLILNNIVKNNHPYGIYLCYGSNNNNIYHNNFINNTNQAYDNGTNQWDDGYPSGGNYWSDYEGEDADNDGIGDTPYSIPGDSNQDRYPFMTIRGVEVSISPSEYEGAPGDTVTFTVTVTNIDEVADTYDLTVIDDAGWGATLDDNLFENVAPDENRQTTVSVIIPENAIKGEMTQITVTVTSQADPSMDDSDTCIAHVAAFPTQLVIYPSSFTLESGQSTTLTATLTAENAPLAGKTISWWSAGGGVISPESGTTDNFGQMSVTYTARITDYELWDNIIATFAGDSQYQGSVRTATALIFSDNLIIGGEEMEVVLELIYDEGKSEAFTNVVVDDEGNVIAVGDVLINLSTGEQAGLIVKYAWSGELLWVKRINPYLTTVFSNVAVDSANNIVIFGTTSTNRHLQDYGGSSLAAWIIAKFSPSGELLWQTYYGKVGGGYHREGINGLVIYNDQIIATGVAGYMFWTIKLSSGGALLWEKQSLSGWFQGQGMTVDQNGDIIIVGEAGGYPAYDVCLVRLSQAGEEIWGKTFDWGDNEAARWVVSDKNNDLMVFGESPPFIMKFTSSGDFIWGKQYQREGIDRAFYALALPDRYGISTWSDDASSPNYYIEYDFEGNLIYESVFQGGSISFDSYGRLLNAFHVGTWKIDSDAAVTIYDRRPGGEQEPVAVEEYQTNLTITPSAFTLQPGGSTTLTVALISNGAPLAEKTVTWDASVGGVAPLTTVTNPMGQASVTYIGPSFENIGTITASFTGDNLYWPSTSASQVTIVYTSPLEATINITPKTLRIGSMGNWMTCYIELPGGDANQIDVSSILLEGAIPVDPTAPTEVGDYDNDGVPDLMVKFARSSVENIVVPGLVTLTVTGRVNGSPFTGSDTIDVITTPATSRIPGALISVRAETPDAEPIVEHDIYSFTLDISTEVSEKLIEVTVGSEAPEGQTIILNIDSDVLPLEDLDNIKVLFDGQKIGMADDYEDVLDPTDENEAEYAIVLGREGVQLLVSIPHFSVHTITVGEVAAAAPLELAAVLAVLGVALIAIMSVALIGIRQARGGAVSILIERGLSNMRLQEVDIFREIRGLKEFTIPELMHETGVSKTVAWYTVQKLIKKRLVRPAGKVKLPTAGRGKPSTVYKYVGD